MSYRLDEIKAEQKRMRKHYKKIRKEILKDLDITDKVEANAFGYLESANKQFDSIVAWMDEQEKHSK